MNPTLKNLIKSDLAEYTVLIVDDNPTNLAVLSNYLETYGFTTLVARDGKSTLKRTEYIQPDIILLDVMMPGIDGFETCRLLKENELTRDIPVIFMTALAETESKVKGFEVGAVDYVTKPLHEQEVLARVTTHLSIRDLTQNLQKQNVALEKRALQLEASNEVGQQTTSILDLNQLLEKTVNLIQTKFGYYFVGVWLLNEAKDALVLQAGIGHDENQSIASGFSIPLDTPSSIVVWVYQTKQLYIANDVTNDPKYMPINLLSDTQSELTLPLQVGDNIIGILDIQSNKQSAFDSDDQTALQTLANQIAIAIRNAQLYHAEKELRYLQEKRAKDLAKLNADKDKFFSIVSHDLRSPFTSLIGHNKFMLKTLDKLSKKDIEEMLESTYNATKNVYNLLDNLLAWANVQRGRMKYQPEYLELKPIAQNTIDLLVEVAANKKIKLINTVSEDITIYADKNMLDTVIRNITSNSIKFTPKEGTVTISSLTTDNNNTVQLSISDTGVGIEEEHLDGLFNIDVSHSTHGTENERGTGLGLILCKEMVEKNGGKIWVESTLGQGTTVRFTIPYHKQP